MHFLAKAVRLKSLMTFILLMKDLRASQQTNTNTETHSNTHTCPGPKMGTNSMSSQI